MPGGSRGRKNFAGFSEGLKWGKKKRKKRNNKISEASHQTIWGWLYPKKYQRGKKFQTLDAPIELLVSSLLYSKTTCFYEKLECSY